MWVQSLGQKDPLEKEMAIPSSVLAWEIPRTEEPGSLQSMGSKRVRHDLGTKQCFTMFTLLRHVFVTLLTVNIKNIDQNH